MKYLQIKNHTVTGTKIDGKLIAQSVKDRVKSAKDELKSQGINPCLATVLVGDDPASATYVRNKHIACKEVGIATKDHKLDVNITQSELSKIIDELNEVQFCKIIFFSSLNPFFKYGV